MLLFILGIPNFCPTYKETTYLLQRINRVPAELLPADHRMRFETTQNEDKKARRPEDWDQSLRYSMRGVCSF